jgi:hypothetical protein
MAGPVGQDQAVAILAQGGENVCGDLAGALLVSGQVLVDRSHAAGAGRVGVVPVFGRVKVQHRGGPAGARKRVLPGWVGSRESAMVCPTGPTDL